MPYADSLHSTMKSTSRGQRTLVALSLLPCLFAPLAANGADWQTVNIQWLHGSNYEDLGGAIDDKSKSVMTVEFANGWKYGDNFFFVDISNPTTTGTTAYGEFSPRLSFGKMTGTDLSFGIIKDVLLAATLEMGEDVHAGLYGFGFALDLPGFAFADANFYYRESDHDVFGESSPGYQVTLDWLLPFTIAGTKWAFEGFFDYAFDEDGGDNPKKDNIITAPRLLLDVGDFWGAPGHLQAGIEYQIWDNKYGIDGVNEDVVQAMLKWTF